MMHDELKKVFVIGVGRTGTCSVMAVLKRLGFGPVFNSDDVIAQNSFKVHNVPLPSHKNEMSIHRHGLIMLTVTFH